MAIDEAALIEGSYNKQFYFGCLAADGSNSDKDSDAVIDAITYSIIGRLGMPICYLELLLTLDCNQHCDYCFIHGRNSAKDMPLEVIKQSVDFLMAASRHQSNVNILPFGGEPLLRFDLVCEIIRYAREQACRHDPAKTVSFSLTTNGTLLDEPKMSFFKEHGIMVLLSLDGDKTTHDRHRHKSDGSSSYDAIAERLPMIKHFQPWLGTRMTVHPEAVDSMLQNFEHMRSIEINQFIIGPATGVPWLPEQWNNYETQMVELFKTFTRLKREGAPIRINMFERDIESRPGGKKGQWGCGAGKGRMAVAPDGGLYPCSKLVGVDALKGALRLGDVWNGPRKYKERGEILAASEEEHSTCQECESKNDCTGGCPATNYEENGDIFTPSKLDCMQTRLLVRLQKELKLLEN